jgi:hypothetical protein
MRDHLGNPLFSARPEIARGVLLLEDCEGAFTWTVTGTGGDDVHAFAAAAAFMGGFGVQLKTRTTDAAPADTLTIRKKFGFPESGLLVARFRLAAVTPADFAYIYVILDFSDGVTGHAACIMLDVAAGKTYYQAAGGGFIEIAALAAAFSAGAFYTVDLQADVLANNYISAMVNGTIADLSGIPLVDGGAVATRFARADITIATAAAAPCECYVDSVYVGEHLEL